MGTKRRTLEEIEALAAEATPGPWWINPRFRADVHCEHGCIAEVIDIIAAHPDSFASEQQQLGNAALIAALPDLLAIAHGQREELKTASSVMEKMAAQIESLRAQLFDAEEHSRNKDEY